MMKSAKRPEIQKGKSVKQIEARELLNLMKSQLTVRNFKINPVSNQKLNKILEAARWAPSAANSQPWDLIVVRDSKTKEKIADIILQSKRLAKEKDKKFPYGNIEALVRRFCDPPILIAVCADTRLMEAYPKFGFREQNYSVSIGAAIQNMMLMAKALGLALSWGTPDKLNMEKLRDLLDAPPHIRVVEILQLGYPVKIGSPGHRRQTREFVHAGKFDGSKSRSNKEIEILLSTRKAGDIYSGSPK